MPPRSPAEVRTELKAFLRQQRIGRVFFAEPGGRPPPLAYLTAFPRLSLTLDGTHPMLIAAGSTSKRIRPGRGDTVFVGSNHWTKPDWSEPATVLTLLFGQRQLGINLTILWVLKT